MFRTSPVHYRERFVQAVFADLVYGNMRTTRHVQPLQSCRKAVFAITEKKSANYICFVIRILFKKFPRHLQTSPIGLI